MPESVDRPAPVSTTSGRDASSASAASMARAVGAAVVDTPRAYGECNPGGTPARHRGVSLFRRRDPDPAFADLVRGHRGRLVTTANLLTAGAVTLSLDLVQHHHARV